MRAQYVFLIILSAMLFAAIGGASVMAGSVSAPTIAWQQVLGGLAAESGASLQPTADGGYILLGQTKSCGSCGAGGGDLFGQNHGGFDLWVAKLDGTGHIQWERQYGGVADETARCIRPTADGGYIVLGDTVSAGGGNMSGTNHGGSDLWVLKLDAMGAIQWQKILGGNANEVGAAIRQTTDGGYALLASSTSSANGDVTDFNYGKSDFWFVKLTGAGAISWQKLYGGADDEFARDLQQTTYGYGLLGDTFSSASGMLWRTGYGGSDAWLLKINDAGTPQGCALLGGNGDDIAGAFEQTPDTGHIVAMSTKTSMNGNVTATNRGQNDLWVAKLDNAQFPIIQWQQFLGGTGDDLGRSVRQTGDGGYVVLAESTSNDGDVPGNHGGFDIWAVRFDGSGAVLWNQVYGGSGTEHARDVQSLADGRYAFLADTASSDGNVAGTYQGANDIWVVGLQSGAPTVVAVPGGSGLPADTNGDGLCDDVNGNGRKDFADVVLFFNEMAWIAANEPMGAFDCNANSRIDFADVVWFFDHL